MTATTRSSSLRTTSSKAVVKSTATNNHNDTPTTTPTAKKDKTKKAPSKTSASKKGKQSKTSTTTDKKNREESLLVPFEGPWYRIFTKGDEEYDRYMATEWGFEKRGNVALFEKMSLEGAQSGLSWLTILRKRNAYRRVFYNFDIDKVAAMTSHDVDRILAEQDKENPSNIIVRHRGKVESVINNAQCIQRMLQEHATEQRPNYFDEFLWSFVNDKPIVHHWNGNLKDANTQIPESIAMSKALKKLGFRFVGPTTMYAMMQSVGMVIDHPVNSPEYKAAMERLKQRKGSYQERP